MPTTYAHYRFGKDVFRALPGELKEVVRRHREAYCIGLYGPDILFYYRPLTQNPVSDRGHEMHRQVAKPFFTGSSYLVRKLVQDDPKRAESALAYILGFICHFALDRGCHGYINGYSERRGIPHNQIETEFDCALLRIDGQSARFSDLTRQIVPSERNAGLAAEFFPDISSEQILEALETMKRIVAVEQGRRPLTLTILKAYMLFTGRYESMRGLIVNKRPDAACEESNRRLLELYRKSVSMALVLIRDYTKSLETGGKLSGAFEHNYQG